MKFSEFLDLVKVLKMLYGAEIARFFFTNNVDKYYNLDSASLLNKKEHKA